MESSYDSILKMDIPEVTFLVCCADDGAAKTLGVGSVEG